MHCTGGWVIFENILRQERSFWSLSTYRILIYTNLVRKFIGCVKNCASLSSDVDMGVTYSLMVLPASQTAYTRQSGQKRLMQTDRHAE